MRVEVAAAPGIDLNARHASGADQLGIDRCLLIALDYGEWQPRLQRLDGLHEKCGFAGARARYEVQRENPSSCEAIPILLRVKIVFRQYVLFDAHQVMGDMSCVRVARVVALIDLVAATAYAAHGASPSRNVSMWWGRLFDILAHLVAHEMHDPLLQFVESLRLYHLLMAREAATALEFSDDVLADNSWVPRHKDDAVCQEDRFFQ